MNDRQSSNGTPLLQAKNLQKTFLSATKKIEVLQGLNLEIPAEEG